jgi:aerotaxis receptor
MNDVTPINEKYEFDSEGVLVSQTDLDGNIIYANKKFREVSGYSYDELIGQNHNIIRHPDMPKATFAKMWNTIKSGQVFNGTIKNLRKNGEFYWVELEILPIKDDNGEYITYMAVARAASEKDIAENEDLYNKMLEAERNKGE